ncbi:MAG: DNA-methyltransferase [Promethearchaeota archaeon]
MHDHKILFGDVWASLFTLEDDSIDCAITSPPYWSQRDYGFDGQIGNEPTLTQYLEKLITIFKLLHRKLKPAGNFYLNIGDKYVRKYGNTPLAMIPYILAYHLVEDGWNLDDTLIWYKTNHMPAPVKNRLTNTYEPIFVFSKNERNYFSDFKRQNGTISNILRIPLQPVPYKHMATYPEKLVEALLGFGLPNDALVLDPFAGSGTTCKTVQNISEGYFNPVKMRSIMIEAQKDYVRIIKQRCQIKKIVKIPFRSYQTRSLNDNFIVPISKSVKSSSTKGESIIIKVFENPKTLHSFYPHLFDDNVANSLDDNGIFFLGLPNHDIKDIYSVAQLNHHGWIIRNIIVVPQGNDWIPIFMLVKDIKSVRYRFNLDNIRVSHQYENQNWEGVDFVGYRVEKSQVFHKNPNSGLIGKIISRHPNGLPHWIVVKWKTREYSVEEVMNESERVYGFRMSCPVCETGLKEFHHYTKALSCPACSLSLWDDTSSIPVLSEINPCNKPEYIHEELKIKKKNTKKDYEGKFKGVERKNIGQSPGARESIEEQYFTTKRYYNVKQSMISDYLNLHRKKKGFTKNALTEKFPKEYKHTVGHWLRKDMGGSLPKYEDLMKLNELLQLDQSYLNYISRTGLKLQTVLTDVRGKNPGDFLDLPMSEVIAMLKQVGE